VELIEQTVFEDMRHDGYREWLQAKGLPEPPSVP
jgi:hypothetical protein